MDNHSLSFEIEAEEIAIFVQDVNEHLQAMETGILQLERKADAQVLSAVFRAAHTLKAIAATISHRQMAELTHALEALFEAMRAGQLSFTPSIGDELLAALDALKALRDEVISLQPSGVDVAGLVERLRALTAQDDAPAPAEPLPGHALTTEQHALLQAFVQRCDAEGFTIFEVQVDVQPEAYAPSARLLQATMALAEIGDLIAQQPTQQTLVDSPHQRTLWLVLCTPAAPSEITACLDEIQELAAFEVRPFEWAPASIGRPDEAAPLDATPARRETPAVSPAQDTDKTVRISIERLDTLMNLVGELVTSRTRLNQIEEMLREQYGKNEHTGALGDMSGHLGRVVDQLQQEVMQARMLPISNLFVKFPRLVRDVARSAGKQVDLAIRGEATELDRSIIETIGDPLMHLVRNAIDHGIEPPEKRIAAGKSPVGTVRLSAAHREGHIVIAVQDDGGGIDPAKTRQAAVRRGLLSKEEAAQLDDLRAVNLVFMPNLSTAEQVTDVSGRGVGMDVVQTNVKQLGGTVSVESQVGQGTTFSITLPLTLAILQTMLVALGDDVYAIPLTGVIECLYLSDQVLNSAKGRPVIRWRNEALPLLSLRQVFAHPRLSPGPVDPTRQAIVVVTWGNLRTGLIVDQLIGKQEIVVKSLSPIIGSVAGLSGCTILGDGRIALIADIAGLINTVMA